MDELPPDEQLRFERNFPMKSRKNGTKCRHTIPKDYKCNRLFIKKYNKQNTIGTCNIYIGEPYPGSGEKYFRNMRGQTIKVYCYDSNTKGVIYGTLYSGTVSRWCEKTKSIVISRCGSDYEYCVGSEYSNSDYTSYRYRDDCGYYEYGEYEYGDCEYGDYEYGDY